MTIHPAVFGQYQRIQDKIDAAIRRMNRIEDLMGLLYTHNTKRLIRRWNCYDLKVFMWGQKFHRLESMHPELKAYRKTIEQLESL